MFVYVLRKHNFTAWVSCSRPQTRNRLQLSNIPQSNETLHSLCCALPKFYFETKFYSAGKKFNRDMNFQRHPFDPLIMRRREIKARDIRLGITLKMGGVVTDTNCQRTSQSLYETIAVSLFARLPPRALLATCSATFPPRIFEQKRDCSQSKTTTNPSCTFRRKRREKWKFPTGIVSSAEPPKPSKQEVLLESSLRNYITHWY